ncbi:probable serine/threonine-protein kinase pats1 [Saccostrea cucullata]|uniref:probable serine/threonine-protein kinase pats1 n=1 Tax=Saccostrea cuccullata TaxID=36930 RepID=UPI002ED63804
MYFQETTKGTETIRRAHAMIVGCAGAGKTTLLRRLMSKDSSMEELLNTTSTVGLEIHPDLFEINPQSFSLKVCSKDSIKEKKLLLNVLDFGGQCAYYACHQVYLQQRAFFLQVVDISKPLEEKVDPFLCNQDGTMFDNYTYGDYFLFWLKWIHTYCDSDTPVIIVATHLDVVPEPQKMKSSFFQRILDLLPSGSNLGRHLSNERCFFTGYPFNFCPQLDPLAKLEKCICSMALSEKWIVNIPTEWVWYGDSICCLLNQRVKIVKRGGLYHQKVFAESEDLMKFYNDIGVIGYFNERLLRDIVIVDVKWFVDAFKYVITDQNHFYWVKLKDNHDWMYFNQTGYLKDSLLNEIWEQRFSVYVNKEDILLYAERLGLLARGKSYYCLRSRVHYVPSMNKRSFDSKGKHLFKTVQNRTTVIVYQFQFFPYFYYFRLIVAMMSDQMPFNLLDGSGEYLYKNLACFLHKDHIVVVAVTKTSIQLQVLHRKNEMQRCTVIEIRNLIENRLKEITETFQRPCRFTIGYQCSYQEVYSHLPDCFVLEQDILGKVTMSCPSHLTQNIHQIREDDIVHFWKEI